MTSHPAERRPAPLLALARAARPHQWAKNLLLVLPAFAAHLTWTIALGSRLVVGFVAFSAAASALYLVNDIADLPHDRTHPRKRHRSLASGAISVKAAAGAAAAGLALAAIAAARLPTGFQLALGVYVVVSLAYSLDLKRRPLLDVVVLATLYTVRIVAGGALVHVTLSRWFLAFSIFLFLSLALTKRVAELQRRPEGEAQFVEGRSYLRADIPALLALGAASSVASALVYCLYVTGEDAARLYRRPDILWFGLPLILYWQARLWLVTNRGDMHDDPVVFAMKDRVSYFVTGAFLLAVLAAT